MVVSASTLQLLDWIGERDRSYGETMEAWHSHCPRLTTWEDALADGLVEVRNGRVVLTPKGRGQTPSRPEAKQGLAGGGVMRRAHAQPARVVRDAP
jgi:hypothetical protein